MKISPTSPWRPEKKTKIHPKFLGFKRDEYHRGLEKFEEMIPAVTERYNRRKALFQAAILPAAFTLISGTLGAVWQLEQALGASLNSLSPWVAIPIGAAAALAPLGAAKIGPRLGKFVREKLTHSPEFDKFRNDQGKIRESYRDELLGAAKDEGVNKALEPRWDELNSSTEYDTPIDKEKALNHHVDELEWLLDMRRLSDWRGDLARQQDDPKLAKISIQEASLKSESNQ